MTNSGPVGRLANKRRARGFGIGEAPAIFRSGDWALFLVIQTAGLEHLLGNLASEPGNYTWHLPVRDRLPTPILKLLRRSGDVADGSLGEPRRMQVSTAGGILTLDAKWLVPACPGRCAIKDWA